MKNYVYILFSCDQWKSRDSMRIVGIYSTIRKLVKQIKKEVAEDNMELGADLQDTERDLHYIDSVLEYGSIEKYEVDAEDDE